MSLRVRQGEEWLQNMNGEEQLDQATETEAEKEKRQRRWCRIEEKLEQAEGRET